MDLGGREMEKDNKEFTKDELNILSLGMLSLINGVNTALNNTYDVDSIVALKRARDRYTELDQKVCGLL